MDETELLEEVRRLEQKTNKVIFVIGEEDIALSILQPLCKSFVKDQHFQRQEVFANELASQLFSSQEFKEHFATGLIDLAMIRKWLIQNKYLFGEN